MQTRCENAEGSDTAEISYTRLRNQLKSNPKSRDKLVNFEIRNTKTSLLLSPQSYMTAVTHRNQEIWLEIRQKSRNRIINQQKSIQKSTEIRLEIKKSGSKSCDFEISYASCGRVGPLGKYMVQIPVQRFALLCECVCVQMYSLFCILYSLVEDSSDCISIPRYSPEFPWLSKYTARGLPLCHTARGLALYFEGVCGQNCLTYLQ